MVILTVSTFLAVTLVSKPLIAETVNLPRSLAKMLLLAVVACTIKLTDWPAAKVTLVIGVWLSGTPSLLASR